MKKLRLFLLFLIFFSLFALPNKTSAQSLRFTVPVSEVEAYIEEDGSLSLYYLIVFDNTPNGAPIDIIDIGMPSSSYSRSVIEAAIDGKPITKIDSSPYASNGFALDLGANAIQPGQSGEVTIWIPGIKDVLYPYDGEDRENYVSFQFSPNWFGPEFDKSTATEYRVTIILPPGVGNDEGVYYYPSKWPGAQEPDDVGRTAEEDRVYYSWFTNNANAHTEYFFGAAFPNNYVPTNTVADKAEYIQPGSPSASPGIFGTILSLIGGNFCCFGIGMVFVLIFGFSIYQGTVGANKRKMSYLPPKMKIEGHGIKRGLTAVEVAVLMEQPMDKVLTMILFGALKKEAVTVLQQDPLKLEVSDPLPEGLHPYEVNFLEAFKQPENAHRAALQKMIVDLVNSVSNKMKGFSRKESIAYYEDIMSRAWKMVEEAETPEVKSETYNQTLEWTMLDDEYQDRTRRTFSSGPVFVPVWWPRYSPSYRESIGGGVRPVTTGTPSFGKPSGSAPSLPNIPGSDFAAGLINGATGMAAGVVGNLTSFTTGITNRTNPIPISTRSGSGGFRGGGGSSCACACACAGCACACAGGGR